MIDGYVGLEQRYSGMTEGLSALCSRAGKCLRAFSVRHTSRPENLYDGHLFSYTICTSSCYAGDVDSF